MGFRVEAIGFRIWGSTETSKIQVPMNALQEFRLNLKAV